ncbi:Ribosome biogenesis protein erb1 [Rhizina undulata]
MPPISPHITTLLTALVAAVAGFYVGKSFGIRAVDVKIVRSQEAKGDGIKDSPPPQSGKGGEDEEWEDADDTDEEGKKLRASVGDVKQWEGNLEDCKMVLVVRTDLGMTKGKIAAQCGHATLMCYKSSLKHAPNLLKWWETYGQTKVAVQAKGEEELLELQAHAMSLGVVAKVVHDAGRTQIAAGSATVLGVGPAPRSVVDQITGHLKLL